ncbi:hypothetical protein DL240_01295 [Lujinxingia litoralis]|uniref:PEGA domain-containing protein n=1 Tax=Lujinxingia litoralis TaxID=2211119 RepID=A0A328CDR5_9DELT|nr:hypothetical protein DL240_01295 [Lujinxingia litoralis]
MAGALAMGATVVLGAAPVLAQNAVEAGVHYGDGLRHLAEGRYAEAVVELHRAYGMAGEAGMLAQVIEAYDAMGHCEAASRQLVLYGERHGSGGAPELKRCARSGVVALTCAPRGEAVRVNGAFVVGCGQEIRLPEGRHRLEREGGQALEVEVQADARIRIEPAAGTPLKGGVARLGGPGLFGTDVQRLPAVSPAYTVYQSADGLYQIWVRRAGESGRRLEDVPRVEIVCPDGEDGESDPGCLWLRELRRSSGYTDNPTRLEVVVPRMP